MIARLFSLLFSLALSCIFLHPATGQTTAAQSDALCRPKSSYLEKVHLADFGLLESYSAEAEGLGMALIVRAGSLAERAGIKTGAILTEINDQPVRNFQELRQVLAIAERGVPILFRYIFENTYQETSMELPLIHDAPITRLYSFRLAECYGLELENYQESENGGVLITSVDEQKVAASGLKTNDIIIEVAKAPISTWSELYEILQVFRGWPTLPLTVLREGQARTVLLETVNCPSGDRPVDISALRGYKFINIEQAIAADQKAKRLLQAQALSNGEPQQVNSAPQAAPAEAANWKEERLLQPQAFRVFPNPNSGLFTLEFSATAAPIQLRLFNISGAMLYSEQVDDFQGSYSRQFDFRDEPPGTLVVRIEQEGKAFSKLVLVQ